MPGTDSRSFRNSNSPYERSSIGEMLLSGDDSENSMISPVIDVIGVISAWALGGSTSRTLSSRSPTWVRAR